MLKQPLGKKRHIIGIMSGYLHADYLSALLEEIDQVLQAEEFEIHFFSGSYTSPLHSFSAEEVGFEYHCYSLFSFRYLHAEILNSVQTFFKTC